MLNLATETGADWVARVLPRLDEVLLEQAHLERKAASMAMTFLFRYQQHDFVQAPLSELAREELEHFELILGVLRRRGVPFRPQNASGYAAQLMSAVRGGEPERLLDSFLCCAVIEARSCERMKLLGQALTEREPDLALMYDGLVRSEARHHGVYVGLAKRVVGPDVVDARLAEITAFEATIQRQQPRLARLHT